MAEREEVDLTGFYVMESHENMEETILQDSGCSAAEAAEIMSSVAARITETNGTYTITDYLGNGHEKSISWKLDQEVDIDHPSLGQKGTQITTKGGPGEYLTTFKDCNGKISTWECVVTEDLLKFKINKPLNTKAGSIVYRKYPDVLGTFKTVDIIGAEGYFAAVGMSDYGKAFALDRPTSVFSYLGKGMFKWQSDSKILGVAPIIWKSGEEFTFTWEGQITSEVITLTKKGLSVVTVGDNIISPFTVTFGKTFAVVEKTLVGNPIPKMKFIYVRI